MFKLIVTKTEFREFSHPIVLLNTLLQQFNKGA